MKTIKRQSLGLIIMVLVSSSLMSCGQKGPLRHPEPNAQSEQSQG